MSARTREVVVRSQDDVALDCTGVVPTAGLLLADRVMSLGSPKP